MQSDAKEDKGPCQKHNTEPDPRDIMHFVSLVSTLNFENIRGQECSLGYESTCKTIKPSDIL